MNRRYEWMNVRIKWKVCMYEYECMTWKTRKSSAEYKIWMNIYGWESNVCLINHRCFTHCITQDTELSIS